MHQEACLHRSLKEAYLGLKLNNPLEEHPRQLSNQLRVFLEIRLLSQLDSAYLVSNQGEQILSPRRAVFLVEHLKARFSGQHVKEVNKGRRNKLADYLAALVLTNPHKLQ